MTNESKRFHRFIYLMQKREDGWFARMQFDGQFKGSIEEVKQLLKVVTAHTEKKGKNEMKWGDNLVNLDGIFAEDEIGEECYRLLLERMKNKPKCYG